MSTKTPNEICDLIYHRHQSAMQLVHDSHVTLHGSIVAFSLRLALAELAAALQDSHSQHCAAIAERDESDSLALRQQLAQFDAEINELHQQLAQMDADNAKLTAELATLRSYAITSQPAATLLNEWLAEHAVDLYIDPYIDTVTAMIAAADRLRGTVQQLQMEMANERTVAAAACARSPQAVAIKAQEAAEDLAAAFTGDLADWRIGLDAGRHTWRTIPRPVRWRLVSAMLRSIWTDGLPTMTTFDTVRPAWMPTASACAMTFGTGKWAMLLDAAKSGESVGG
jgi:cell division protein FtsB